MSPNLEKKEEPVSLREGLSGAWRLIRPYRGQLWLLSILGIISAIANGFVPYVTGRFFDSLIDLSKGTTQEWSGMAFWLVLLIAWFVIRILGDAVDWWIDRKKRWLYTNIQPNTLDMGGSHLLRLPLSFHTNEHIHEITQRMNAAAWRMSSIAQTVTEIVPQLLSIGIGLVLAYSINPFLAGVLLAGVLLYAIVLLFLLPGTAARSQIAYKVWGEVWDNALSAITQVQAVKYATAEQYETNRMHKGWHDRVI
ncbi:MAG TPA: ABC transporter transmembrane domain-containing protein, partial [Chitinophagaceae bacterium]|nr:ABC transporter transmembrane domain-containing protein [Chitinophagaceae bacterium]